MDAERKLISKVAVEDISYVVIAESVVLIDVVGVLLEGHVGAGLAPRGIAIPAVVTLVVGQAFCPRIVDLKRQPVAEPPLECMLEGIVVLTAHGRVTPILASAFVIPSRISRAVWTRS